MKTLKKIFKLLIPFYSSYQDYCKSRVPASYCSYLKYCLGLTKRHWPKDKNCTIANYKNIHVGINCLIGRSGVYIQGAGNVYFGNYVQLAPNVGVLSANHDLYDQNKYNIKPIKIGDYCWIGMNSVVLAGVELGTRTVVAAGSVVTKSFPAGFCVIGGNPAKVIKYLEKDKFVPWKYDSEYYGFIPKEKYEKDNKKIKI